MSSSSGSMLVREVTSLPIAPSLIDLLKANGFRYTSDLEGMQPLLLARELKIAAEVAMSILKSLKVSPSSNNDTGAVTSSSSSYTTLSAFQLSNLHTGEKYVITFCKAIDIMLGGGIPIGQITEFVGVPAIGKTQMCIQIALNVQLPQVIKGVEGECIYIDTEGSFTAVRAAEMADELSSHILKATINRLMKESRTQGLDLHSMSHAQLMTLATGSVLENKDKLQLQSALACSRDHLLRGIHVIRVHDQTELLAAVGIMNKRLEMNPKIKLVIVDSIAFHFRQEEKGAMKAKLLANITQTLNSLCFDFGVACVVTNHVTTYVDKMSGTSMIIPALGEVWYHGVSNRITLDWKHEQPNFQYVSSGDSWPTGQDHHAERVARLDKSSYRPSAEASYIVSEKGIRDVKRERGEKRPAPPSTS